MVPYPAGRVGRTDVPFPPTADDGQEIIVNQMNHGRLLGRRGKDKDRAIPLWDQIFGPGLPFRLSRLWSGIFSSNSLRTGWI